MEEQQVEVQDVKQDTADTASEEKQPVNQVPYARFSEMVDEKNTLKVELDSLKKNAKEETESRKLKQMEEKGEYEKIMAEMTTKYEDAKKKADAFDEYQVTKRDSLLSKLPEEDRAIYEGLPLENWKPTWKRSIRIHHRLRLITQNQHRQVDMLPLRNGLRLIPMDTRKPTIHKRLEI